MPNQTDPRRAYPIATHGQARQDARREVAAIAVRRRYHVLKRVAGVTVIAGLMSAFVLSHIKPTLCRARRADALLLLSAAVHAQERYFAEYSHYARTPAALGFTTFAARDASGAMRYRGTMTVTPAADHFTVEAIGMPNTVVAGDTLSIEDMHIKPRVTHSACQ